MEWMGGDFPPTWNHSPDGLAVKAGDAEQSIFSGVDPALTAEAVKRLNWQGMRAFTEKVAADADRRSPDLRRGHRGSGTAARGTGTVCCACRPQCSCSLRALPALSHTDEVADVLAKAVPRASSNRS
jgi:hypothetical protein